MGIVLQNVKINKIVRNVIRRFYIIFSRKQWVTIIQLYHGVSYQRRSTICSTNCSGWKQIRHQSSALPVLCYWNPPWFPSQRATSGESVPCHDVTMGKVSYRIDQRHGISGHAIMLYEAVIVAYHRAHVHGRWKYKTSKEIRFKLYEFCRNLERVDFAHILQGFLHCMASWCWQWYDCPKARKVFLMN